jgi:hypothetical protein
VRCCAKLSRESESLVILANCRIPEIQNNFRQQKRLIETELKSFPTVQQGTAQNRIVELCKAFEYEVCVQIEAVGSVQFFSKLLRSKLPQLREMIEATIPAIDLRGDDAPGGGNPN